MSAEMARLVRVNREQATQREKLLMVAKTVKTENWTYREGIIALFVFQQWRHCPLAPDGRHYGPAWFTSPKRGYLSGLNWESRKIILKYIAESKCWACQQGVAVDKSVGDHIIASSRGGRNFLTNYLPMCVPCNRSKGTLDMLAWWLKQGKDPATLPIKALCIYARLHWQELPAATLEETCPDYLLQFVSGLLASLPSSAHQAAMQESIHHTFREHQCHG